MKNLFTLTQMFEIGRKRWFWWLSYSPIPVRVPCDCCVSFLNKCFSLVCAPSSNIIYTYYELVSLGVSSFSSLGEYCQNLNVRKSSVQFLSVTQIQIAKRYQWTSIALETKIKAECLSLTLQILLPTRWGISFSWFLFFSLLFSGLQQFKQNFFVSNHLKQSEVLLVKWWEPWSSWWGLLIGCQKR